MWKTTRLHRSADMLKRDGKPEKERKRSHYREVLVLLVVPPLTLLAWLATGVDRTWGSAEDLHRLETQWCFNDPIQSNWIRRWQGVYGRNGTIIDGWGFQIGCRQASFMVDYQRQLQTIPRGPSLPTPTSLPLPAVPDPPARSTR